MPRRGFTPSGGSQAASEAVYARARRPYGSGSIRPKKTNSETVQTPAASAPVMKNHDLIVARLDDPQGAEPG
jgi:hypothetical protein